MNPLFTRPRIFTETHFSKFAVKFKKHLQKISVEGTGWVLVLDRNVARSFSLRSLQSDNIFIVSVQAGESLKTLEAISLLAAQVHKWSQKSGRSIFGFVAMGGGSVGDAVGLLASLWQRGRPLIHVPTTWLAAIDSSHGGKTAINFAGAKNQLGTFWFSSEVWLVQEVLAHQDIRFCVDSKKTKASGGIGELLKIALLDRPFFLQFESFDIWNPNLDQIWRALPVAIEAKYKIVAQDPYETKKTRRLLNFGHTLGHVFEILLGISHGNAVGLGLHFAILWGIQRNISQASLSEYCEKLSPLLSMKKKLNWRAVEILLRKDKKQEARMKIDFIFLKTVGQPVRIAVTLNEIRREMKSQGWI